MKLSLVVVASLCIVAQAATDPAKRPEVRFPLRTCPSLPNVVFLWKDVCPRPRSEIPFYRAYNDKLVDHFYTTNRTEWQNSLSLGYTPQGIAGYIFATEEASTVPLLRLFNPTLIDHYYTTSEAGAIGAVKSEYVREGIAGYIFARQVCGSQPLFRLYHPTNMDNFYTANWEERSDAINLLQYMYPDVPGYIIG